jgi:hypothetical protein
MLFHAYLLQAIEDSCEIGHELDKLKSFAVWSHLLQQYILNDMEMELPHFDYRWEQKPVCTSQNIGDEEFWGTDNFLVIFRASFVLYLGKVINECM